MEVIESKQAFLFSLVNPFGTEPVRIPADEKESGCVIACKKSLGPSFGQDYWSEKYLHISNNAQSSRSSYSRLRVLEENKEICSSRVLKILPSMITKCLNFTSDNIRTLSTSVVGLAKDVREWKINSTFVKEVDL